MGNRNKTNDGRAVSNEDEAAFFRKEWCREPISALHLTHNQLCDLDREWGNQLENVTHCVGPCTNKFRGKMSPTQKISIGRTTS